MMTNRERIVAILEGRSPDRIPWIPRIKLWYDGNKNLGTLPDRFKNMSLREVERALGLGTPARGKRVYRSEYRNMDVIVRNEGLFNTTEYVTPKGTIRSVKRMSEEEARLGIEDKITTEFPLKTAEDYDVWMYVVENTVYVPTYDWHEGYDRDIGDDGLPMVMTGDCPFNYWLRLLAGYQYAYLHLSDFKDRVEALLKLMAEKEKEMWKIVAASPVKLLCHGVHFSSQLTPPRYFDRYITPYYQEYTSLLRAHGKFLATHADNDTSAILNNIKEAGFNMVECFVTAPQVKVTLKQAREVLGTSVIIWGGIPSIILDEVFRDEERFDAYLRDLFRTIAPGDAFILGIGDTAVASSRISRIEKITRMVEEHGHYPITL